MESSRAKTCDNCGRQKRPDPARIRAAKIALLDAGKRVAEWAEEHGESRDLVHKVLSGRRSCASGASQRIAVKLGIVDNAHA